ncbi:hypothetical protein [Halarchaeum acidiphilum]|uniref:hypothetical protein n=1 Tax=Halarchaeum acidiphilum TaxID=489138 RepID=UPI0003815FC9|nr:hypothetical protein [Halarchaeum acidiphilum]
MIVADWKNDGVARRLACTTFGTSDATLAPAEAVVVDEEIDDGERAAESGGEARRDAA